MKDGLGFFNTFLLVFAFIALFVGSFIIYNTFSIIVAQRSRELALLPRARRVSGKQVTRSVAVEAFVVGLLSSVLGLALGVLVAIGLQDAARGVRFRAARRGAGDPRPRTVIVALVVGTVVTFVSALSPARRAAKRAAGGRDARHAGRRRAAATGATAIGGPARDHRRRPRSRSASSATSSSDDVPGGAAGVVGVAAFLVFIGVAMLSPLVARPVVAVPRLGPGAPPGHVGRARPGERDAQPAAHRRPPRRR